MGARYYSTELGRFIQPDPLYIEMHRLGDPQSLNLYAYARGAGQSRRRATFALVPPVGHIRGRSPSRTRIKKYAQLCSRLLVNEETIAGCRNTSENVVPFSRDKQYRQ